jgi:hypothetical protein
VSRRSGCPGRAALFRISLDKLFRLFDGGSNQ